MDTFNHRMLADRLACLTYTEMQALEKELFTELRLNGAACPRRTALADALSAWSYDVRRKERLETQRRQLAKKEAATQ